MASSKNNEEEKNLNNSGMIKVASFIVDKRMLFFLIYAIAIIFSAFSSGWVKTENDISSYLAEDTETKSGLDIMDKEFVTFGSAKIMVANVSYNEASDLKKSIEDVKGVQSVTFTDEDDDQEDFVKHYNNGSALFSVTIDYPENDDRALKTLEAVEDKLSGYDTYINTTLGDQEAESLNAEMKFIYVIVAIVVLSVLLFTSESYGEIPVMVITFVSSMILNNGTNFLMGTISFISGSVSSILQLALSVDYAIILCNRYKEERGNGYDVRDAVIVALSKAIPEISSSSLTTISGLFALIFMRYGIGKDLGTVLIKAIFLSLLSVFTLMPGLLVLFAGNMERTRHRSFIPRIDFVGKYDYATRFFVPVIFAVVIVFAAIFSQRCPYTYNYTYMKTPRLNNVQIARNMIDENFGRENYVAVVVPNGNYTQEKALCRELESNDDVDHVVALSNTEAKDNYMLTDSLSPREFSEMMDVDYDLCTLIYSMYASDQDEYGRIVGGIDNFRVPVMDMLEFLYEKVDEGYVTLDDDTYSDLKDAYNQITDARKQLEGDHYDRMLVYLNLPIESDDTLSFLDTMHDIIREHFQDGNIWVVGDSTSVADLKSSFETDNIIVSVVSILFVLVILLFTFKSAGLPILLILVIEGSIFINFSYPYLMHEDLFFLAYLIVSSIQMGANIDYAIVISSRYMELRKTHSRKETIIESMNFAFPTIITSGSMMVLAGFAIGMNTSNAAIVGVGMCLGRGTLISIILVMFVLPQILVVGDKFIQVTTFDISRPIRLHEETHSTMLVNGMVRGRINGTVVGRMNAYVNGDISLVMVSGDIEKQKQNSRNKDVQGINGPVAEVYEPSGADSEEESTQDHNLSQDSDGQQGGEHLSKDQAQSTSGKGFEDDSDIEMFDIEDEEDSHEDR